MSNVPQIDQLHNLDDSVIEYFEFQVKGHIYRFRQLNTEESDQLKKLEDDDEKSREYIFKFITKVNPESPEFSEMAKKMIMPHWRRFRAMIEFEMGNQNGKD